MAAAARSRRLPPTNSARKNPGTSSVAGGWGELGVGVDVGVEGGGELRRREAQVLEAPVAKAQGVLLHLARQLPAHRREEPRGAEGILGVEVVHQAPELGALELSEVVGDEEVAAGRLEPLVVAGIGGGPGLLLLLPDVDDLQPVLEDQLDHLEVQGLELGVVGLVAALAPHGEPAEDPLGDQVPAGLLAPPAVEVDEGLELLGARQRHQGRRVLEADLPDQEVEVLGGQGADQLAGVLPVEDHAHPLEAHLAVDAPPDGLHRGREGDHPVVGVGHGAPFQRRERAGGGRLRDRHDPMPCQASSTLNAHFADPYPDAAGARPPGIRRP